MERQGSSLCLGNGSSTDISEKMSACSGVGRGRTFNEKTKSGGKSWKNGQLSLETPHFSAKTSILRDGWVFVCQFGLQKNCDEFCVRYHFLVPGPFLAVLHFHLFFVICSSPP